MPLFSNTYRMDFPSSLIAVAASLSPAVYAFIRIVSSVLYRKCGLIWLASILNSIFCCSLTSSCSFSIVLYISASFSLIRCTMTSRSENTSESSSSPRTISLKS